MRGFFSKLKNVEAIVFFDATIENLLPQIGENSEIHALLEGHNDGFGEQFWNVIICLCKINTKSIIQS